MYLRHKIIQQCTQNITKRPFKKVHFFHLRQLRFWKSRLFKRTQVAAYCIWAIEDSYRRLRESWALGIVVLKCKQHVSN